MEDDMQMELEPAKCNMLPSVLSMAGDGRLSVLDLSTKKFHSLHNEALENAVCIRTKGDWLLLHDKEDCYDVFLLNIITGVRIDLPKKEKIGYGFMDFSIISGNPHRVVHVCNRLTHGICIQVICPGDPTWENHWFCDYDRGTRVNNALLVEDLVLCFSARGRTIVFNLSDGSGIYSSRLQPEARGYRYFLESDGEAFKVVSPFPRFSSFTFSRFDLLTARWIELSDHELEDTSWFISSFGAFRAKEAGKKVYTLCPKLTEDPACPRYEESESGQKFYVVKAIEPESECAANVYIHDLVDGSTRTLLPDPFVVKSALWLDADYRSEVCRSYAS